MKKIKCPECGTVQIEEVKLTSHDVSGGVSHIYPELTCENGHEFGAEAEVATILQ